MGGVPLDEPDVLHEIRQRSMHTLELDGSPGPNVMLGSCVGIDLHAQADGTWMIGWRTPLGRQLLVPLTPFASDADAVACAHRLAAVMTSTMEAWTAAQTQSDHTLH
ncbi:hypothetical protein [uncultured Deinococcus sp.]|uniref:hypothetical protein n=1 Tax=uncultured Deinococcus sp. TaxID=158789 RepID=UPI0025D8217E|nr:hypothetical protein [uncultured Deinococcus sp.]